MSTIGAVSDFVRNRQRTLWARALRQLAELEIQARLLRENLEPGLDSLEEYQRPMMTTHVLDLSTDLLSYAQRVATDLERISWMEEIP
jgi:hypothetical protein